MKDSLGDRMKEQYENRTSCWSRSKEYEPDPQRTQARPSHQAGGVGPEKDES